MPPLKGQRLLVLLGAAEVRRRLKGHGFGVRRVESAGTKRAVIIHTATGAHLRQLESLFQDALAAKSVGETHAPELEDSESGWPPSGDDDH